MIGISEGNLLASLSEVDPGSPISTSSTLATHTWQSRIEGQHEHRIRHRTHRRALEREWAASDLILMNPPFIPWNGLTKGQKDLLRATLSDAYKGHSDLAMAFLLKAVDALKPGGVVASVLPAALLNTVSGSELRERILDRADIIGIGKFEGYTYFKTSFVEPAFVVLRRKIGTEALAPPARVLIAKEGAEDKALRSLRLAEHAEPKDDKQVEIFSVPGSLFHGGLWLPERQRGL